MTDELELRAAGDVELDLFGFVLAKAGFVLTKSELSGDDGTTTLTDASLMSFVLSNASLFIGVGGRFNPTTARPRPAPAASGSKQPSPR